MSRYAYRAGRRGPETKGASSATRGRFLLSARYPMAGSSGTPSGVPVSFGPVREPAVVRHHIVVAGEVADSSKPKESDMSNDTKGARPKSTQTITNADGSLCWITEQAAIKRLRRHLTKIGHTFQITREGTPDRALHGEYLMLDQEGVVTGNIELEEALRRYGLLADGELIMPRPRKHWRYHLARQRIEVIDGKTIYVNDQLTRAYSSEDAALKAGSRFKDQDRIIVVGWDASYKGGA